MRAVRDAFGEALVELGGKNQDIVVLDADLSVSTKTCMFAEKYPERFFNVGVAEQNLIGIAAGLASCGKIPFVSTFAVFAPGRCYDQIKNSIAAPKLNVKIVATHGGITTGPDGLSHQSIEDIGIMRTMPNFKIIIPADATETKKAINAAAEYHGPIYIRLCRMSTPIIFGDNYNFEIGKSVLLEEGKDIAIFATGVMVAEALKAKKLLKAEGIDAAVVNMHTIKPIDHESIIKFAKETGTLITAEDHSIIGGLGSAVAEVLAESRLPVKMKRVGVKDVFCESGETEELMKKYDICSEHIVKSAKELLS